MQERKDKSSSLFSVDGAILLDGYGEQSREPIDVNSPVIADLNSVFDIRRFRIPRRPTSLGMLSTHEAGLMIADFVPGKVTDLPIKFPNTGFRIPREFGQFGPLIQRIANFERRINPRYDEYYCYLTVHQALVARGLRQRPSPCHVDGFQGARWQPKVPCNHSYVVSNALPTVYHAQAFELDHLDDAKHNFFHELNRQVEVNGGAHWWQPQSNELVLMDCYCVHQGACATEDVWRTFVRVSFEVRIFDHMDNGHNPLFTYDWPLVDRHIGKLGLSIWSPG